MRYDCYEMARPKCYETAALKQKAYRERQKNLQAKSGRLGVSELRTEKPDERDSGNPMPSRSKIEELRELVKLEESRKPKERATMPVVKPLIYRNDYGAVITESQYNALQEKKRVAKEKGYVLDEYSQ